jgi:hypothetical protein
MARRYMITTFDNVFIILIVFTMLACKVIDKYIVACADALLC